MALRFISQETGCQKHFWEGEEAQGATSLLLPACLLPWKLEPLCSEGPIKEQEIIKALWAAPILPGGGDLCGC